MTRFQRITAKCSPLLVVLGLAACSGGGETNVVAASPIAITITTTRVSEPTEQAEAHCAKHGKKALSRGGVKLGAPAFKVMWGFDCVEK